MEGYVDVFLLALPKKNLKKYCEISNAYGKLMKKHGVLEYREFLGDDLRLHKNLASFKKKVNLKPGEVVITSIIGYKSKAHRAQLNKNIQKEPGFKKMMEEMTKNPIHDSKRMCYGGFKTIVKI